MKRVFSHRLLLKNLLVVTTGCFLLFRTAAQEKQLTINESHAAKEEQVYSSFENRNSTSYMLIPATHINESSHSTLALNVVNANGEIFKGANSRQPGISNSRSIEAPVFKTDMHLSYLHDTSITVRFNPGSARFTPGRFLTRNNYRIVLRLNIL